MYITVYVGIPSTYPLVWLLVDKSHRGIPDYVVLIRAQHVQVCVLSVQVKEGQPAVMPGHIHSQVYLGMYKYF